MTTQQIILDTHIIEPRQETIGSVIWMHGLGADNRNFDSLIPDITQHHQLPLRFIFPNAPIRPVHINQNAPTRAWYDIYSLTDLNKEDHHGMEASRQAIMQLIQQEIEKGTPPHRIVIAGFSQGGAMALYTGMRQPLPIAGILALSCYLPMMHEHQDKSIITAHTQTPVFIAHGTYDMTLPCLAGKMAYEIVKQSHPNTRWHEYAMGHEITPEVTRDIHHFFKTIFSN